MDYGVPKPEDIVIAALPIEKEEVTDIKIPEVHNPMGRPTVMTPDVISKLEHAFSMGCTDLEACLYSDISSSTLYDYQKEHPEFLERKDELKQTPFLKARNTIINALQDKEMAKWYMERKLKKEFAQRTELTGDEGEKLEVTLIKYAKPLEIESPEKMD